LIHLIIGLVLRVVVVLSGAALATFALLWHAPGDPALAIALARYDAQVSSEVVDQIRAEVGLDASFWSAFKGWITPLLTGDLGQSSVTGRDVWPDLKIALSHTVPLAILGLAIGMLIAVPLALLATEQPGGWLDRLAVAIASVGAAIPPYWLGLLLILLFAVQLSWLPAMGARTTAHLILPALTLGLGVAASLTRRRGVDERYIERDHVAPHAAIPVVTVFGLELAFLLEGAIVVEVIFARPGLGSFLVKAIGARDFPKVQAVVIVAALLFVVVNLIIDLIYRALDPRINTNDA